MHQIFKFWNENEKFEIIFQKCNTFFEAILPLKIYDNLNIFENVRGSLDFKLFKFHKSLASAVNGNFNGPITQKFQKSVKRLIPRKYLKSHQNSRAQFNQNYKGQFHQNLKPLTHLSMSPSSIIWNPTFKCSTTILFSRKKRVESQTSLE